MTLQLFPGTNAHILIVDDDENITLLLERMLESHYKITRKKSGFEALAQLKRQHFDLVLADVRMPVINGYQLLQKIRSDATHSELPVILMSSLSEAQDIVQGLELGASDYITKPLNRREVLARIHTHMTLKRLMDERKQAISDLERIHQTRERFFRMASHDLKNPMNQIRMAQFLLRGTVGDEPENSSLLDTIEAALATMEDIVHEFLESAALQNQSLDLEIGAVSVDEVLWEVLMRYNINAQRKRTLLKIDSAPGTVRGDTRRIIQAVSNLVSNAIKYSPTGSIITLNSEERGATIRITVKDEGPGIPEDEHGKLFTEFGKLSTQPTEGEGRTGLGLWIVKQLVEMQQGKVGVDCPGDGGSVFWIDLPVWSKKVTKSLDSQLVAAGT